MNARTVSLILAAALALVAAVAAFRSGDTSTAIAQAEHAAALVEQAADATTDTDRAWPDVVAKEHP